MTLEFEELKKLAKLLQSKTGIYLDDEKLKRYKKRIEEIIRKSGIENFHSYYHQIRFIKNQELLQELIEAVTVNETYFWREHEEFEILVNEILPKFITPNDLKRVRILVLPSSSGEEVYSIMIAISEKKEVYERLHIEIVGADIDSNMIQKAKKGIYSRRSVEKLPKEYIEKYLTKIGDFYQIDRNLIRYANFVQANLFDRSLKMRLGEFDIVFSRNMLIYFDDQTKQKAFEKFYKMIKPSGYLFLGHADANGIDKRKFKPVKKGYNVFMKS